MMAVSRSFKIEFDDDTYVLALSPFCDMLNHVRPQEADMIWDWDKTTKGIVFKARKDILKDEEVYTTYGRHDTS